MNMNQQIYDEIAHINRMTMRAHHVFSVILLTEENELIATFVNTTIGALYPTIHPAVFPKSFTQNPNLPLNPQNVAQYLASLDLNDTDIVFFLNNANVDPVSIDLGQEEVFLVKTVENGKKEFGWQLDMVMKSNANPVSFFMETLQLNDPAFSQWIDWLVSQCDPDTGEFYDPDAS